MKRYFILACLFGAVILTAATAAAVGESKLLRHISNPSYTDLDGNKRDLNEHRGKVLLLNFWASWCSPCIMEVPELNKIHKKYNAKGFDILSLSLDAEFGVTRIKDIAKRIRMNYPIGKAHKEMIGELGIMAIPTSMLFDKNGQVVRRYMGPPNPELLEKDIQKALGK